MLNKSQCLTEAASIISQKIQIDSLDDRANQPRDTMVFINLFIARIYF